MACEGKKIAKLTYVKNHDKKKTVEFKAPIEVETESIKIWRYGGSGVNSDCSPIGSYEFTATGKDAVIASRSDHPSFPGCTIQVIIIDDLEQYGAFPGDAYLISEGESDCIIKVKNKNFQDTYKCGTEYEVICDDDCPPGHIKCEHNGYPGYCCIPCKSTAERINNLASRIKNNG
jgi:hypothetical protein